MPLSGITKVGEYTENLAIWVNNPTLVTTFLGRDLTDNKWDTALDIEFAGANYIQAFFWAQKMLGTQSVGSQMKKVDIEIHARKQAAAALQQVLICRVEFGPEENAISVAPTFRPINDVAIDNTFRWYMATRIDMTQPASKTFPYAINAFGARPIQGNSLGAFLQIPTKGFTEFMIRVKQVADAESPSKVLVLSGAR